MSGTLSTAANRRLPGTIVPHGLIRLIWDRVAATSKPSPSYFAKADAAQINAQQKAHAEALLEQNVALKRRIDELQQKDSTIQNLQGEIERLKKELESRPSSQSAPPNGETPDASSAKPDDFSKVDTLDFTDPSEIMLFPRSEADYQAFLISQMQLNDEMSAELSALVRRRFEVLFSPSFPSRSYLALATQKTHEPDQTQPSGGG